VAPEAPVAPETPVVPELEGATISLAASAAWIRDIDRELADQFLEESGISVDLQATPDDMYESVLMTRMATGEGPDIFMGETGLALMRFQPERYAVDLSNEPWMDRLPDFMLDQAGINGVIYGFTTWGRDFRAMNYNTEIFDAYGIPVPTSYDTFAQACEVLLDNGITPVFYMGAEEWYHDMIFDGAINIESRAPGTYQRLNNRETTYVESAEAIKFLNNLADSAERGFFGSDYMSFTFDQGPPGLASGQFAMWYGWATFVNDVEAAGGPPADSWLAFPMPYADDFSVLAMTGAGMTRMINRDSGNIDAAKAYFNFLARAENLQAFYDGRIDLLESTLLGATAAAPRNFDHALQLVSGRTLPSPRQGVLFQGADAHFGRNIQSMLFGLMEPEQVLSSLDTARERTFESLD
jgi:raffinose/stachyose/melibiose transport system substrate-binding protein